MQYKIKELRENASMTQEQLAEKSGITRVTIARLESGMQSDLKVSSLKKLAEALSCKVGDLIA